MTAEPVEDETGGNPETPSANPADRGTAGAATWATVAASATCAMGTAGVLSPAANSGEAGAAELAGGAACDDGAADDGGSDGATTGPVTGRDGPWIPAGTFAGRAEPGAAAGARPDMAAIAPSKSGTVRSNQTIRGTGGVSATTATRTARATRWRAIENASAVPALDDPDRFSGFSIISS